MVLHVSYLVSMIIPQSKHFFHHKKGEESWPKDFVVPIISFKETNALFYCIL